MKSHVTQLFDYSMEGEDIIINRMKPRGVNEMVEVLILKSSNGVISSVVFEGKYPRSAKPFYVDPKDEDNTEVNLSYLLDWISNNASELTAETRRATSLTNSFFWLFERAGKQFQKYREHSSAFKIKDPIGHEFEVLWIGTACLYSNTGIGKINAVIKNPGNVNFPSSPWYRD